MQEAIISIKPEHVKNIQDGKKTVELRRKSMKLNSGDKVWIYSTLPQGEIVGYFIVDKVVQDTPKNIWRAYAKEGCVPKKYFEEYFGETKMANAIIIEKYIPIEISYSLYEMREKITGWQPPQFMQWVKNKSSMYEVLRA